VSGAAPQPQGTFFQRYLLPGFAMKGVIIGGGYATGRELAEYFLSHGPAGALMAMGLAMLLWSLVAALTFALARKFAAYDYRSFMARLLGHGWILFEIGYLLFAVLLLAVFGAAAGEVGKSLLPVPAIAGTLALALATWLVASRGGWAVEAMFKYVSILLYSVYALFLILAVTRFGDRIGAGLERGGADSGWVLGGLTYGSYNLVAAVMILPMLTHIATRREAVIAGVIAGPLAMLPGFFFLLAMIGFHPEILAHTLPSDFLLREIGFPVFRVLFQIMVFGALLESSVGVVHAVNERALKAWNARRDMPPPRMLRPLLTVALLALCMFIADRIGLVALIASGYRLMALFFLIVFVLPVLTVGVAKLWRREEPIPDESPQHG
jgi:uncharacterized membrane protein YkvI